MVCEIKYIDMSPLIVIKHPMQQVVNIGLLLTSIWNLQSKALN